MFQLSFDEAPTRDHVISSWGGRRTPPYAFTEQGVAMLSSVLHSERAAQVNVEIMRTFVRLRELLSSHADLARKLTALEHKYDAQFKAVFDAIRALMAAPATTKRKIGCRHRPDGVPFSAESPEPGDHPGVKVAVGGVRVESGGQRGS